jgi:hypothetical protein
VNGIEGSIVVPRWRHDTHRHTWTEPAARFIVYGFAWIVLQLTLLLPSSDSQSVFLIAIGILVATLMVVHSHIQRRRKRSSR